MENAGEFENVLFSTVNQVVENLCYRHFLNNQNLHLFAKTCTEIKKQPSANIFPNVLTLFTLCIFRQTDKDLSKYHCSFGK